MYTDSRMFTLLVNRNDFVVSETSAEWQVTCSVRLLILLSRNMRYVSIILLSFLDLPFVLAGNAYFAAADKEYLVLFNISIKFYDSKNQSIKKIYRYKLN